MRDRWRTSARSAYLATCFVAVAGLGFVAGSVATLSEAGPARVVENAYRAGHGPLQQGDAVQRSAAVRPVAARRAPTSGASPCYDPAKAAERPDPLHLRPRPEGPADRHAGPGGARVGRAVQPALGQDRGGQDPAARLATSTSRRPISIPTAICWRSTSPSATRPGAMAWSSTTRTTTSSGSIWPTSTMT